jgi:hypothetical protein
MNLVLKIPKDKPPFIGVRYDRHIEANALNHDLFEKSIYSLHIKPMHRKYDSTILYKIVLELKSHDLKSSKTYTPYYNPNEFKEWFKAIRSHIHFNFGQVYSQEGEDKIARLPSGKPFVLKICGLFMEDHS